MSIDEMLARPGLAAEDRLLVAVAVAIWRADWEQLQRCAHAARPCGQERAEFEETLLQAVLFCGFPRVVTAFERLAEAWPAPQPPSGGGLPPAEQRAAGRALFAGIYGRNDAAVRTLLASCHGEFHDFVLEAAYGRILTRPRLAPLRRELLAVGLLAAQEQQRQFLAHARGALHFGATREQLREVLVTTFGEGPRVDDWLQRVR